MATNYEKFLSKRITFSTVREDRDSPLKNVLSADENNKHNESSTDKNSPLVASVLSKRKSSSM